MKSKPATLKTKNTVLVTGADGMLGNSVVRELLRRKYTVKAFIEQSKDNGTLTGLPVQIHYGDLLNPDTYNAILPDCDYLINCAAITNVYPRKNDLCNKLNNDAVMDLAGHVLKSGIKRFVHVGTANSFKGGTKCYPGNENCPFDLKKYGMDYINSKYQAQVGLLKMHKKEHLPVVIVNPTFMIGPYDMGPSSGKMILHLICNKLPGYSDGGRSFVYSIDVARAIVNALESGRPGECYIVGGENLTYREFLMKACDVLNLEFNLSKIPSFLMKLCGFFSSVWARLIAKPPVLSYGMSLLAGKDQYYSSEKAVREIGYKQTPIEQAIYDCVLWFIENGKLEILNYGFQR